MRWFDWLTGRIRRNAPISAAEMAHRRARWEQGRCSYTPDCPCGDDLPAWTRDPEKVRAVLYRQKDAG